MFGNYLGARIDSPAWSSAFIVHGGTEHKSLFRQDTETQERMRRDNQESFELRQREQAPERRIGTWEDAHDRKSYEGVEAAWRREFKEIEEQAIREYVESQEYTSEDEEAKERQRREPETVEERERREWEIAAERQIRNQERMYGHDYDIESGEDPYPQDEALALTFRPLDEVGDRVLDTTCVVCLELLTGEVAMFRCRHALHEACATDWMLSKRESGSKATCPVCRGPIVPPD